VEEPTNRPAGEEVDPAPTQLASARALGEDEARAPLLDQRVHDGEKLRHPLHLVDHDRVRFGRTSDQVAEPLRLREELPLDVRPEQVEDQSPGELGPQPRGLPGPAGAEQEEALLGRRQEST
jgi:hypothetical protein